MENLFIGSPLEQFTIVELVTMVFLEELYSISVFNSVLVYELLAMFIVLVLLKKTLVGNRIVSNNFNIFIESIYFTVLTMIEAQLGKRGEVYFPYIFALFTVILLCNLVSNIPGSFAATSHLIFTLGFSFTIFFGVTFLAVRYHGIKIFSLFCPTGTPLVLVPLLVLIEGVSYVARGVSLGLRLGANIMAGHMLTIILAGFVVDIMSSGFFMFFVGMIPLGIYIAISILELVIGIIQAYVFVILTCSYIKDCIELH